MREQKPQKRVLSKAELNFVSSFFHNVYKDRLPTQVEFQATKIQSKNIRQKFAELQDVQDSKFYDLIVNVIKWYDNGDTVTLWVTDYTTNDGFHHFVIPTGTGQESQDGDPGGYLNKFRNGAPSDKDWPGPYGKQSFQITCWEPHATVIRNSNLGPSSWVKVKNVQVRYGKNGSNREGFLREDRRAFGNKIQMEILKSNEDAEQMDPLHVAGLRRKRDYEKDRRQQLKHLTDAAQAGQKRKAAAQSAPKNARKKRTAKRAAKPKGQVTKSMSESGIHESDKLVPDTALNPQGEFVDKC